ncbi:hypothetical protein [Herbiconiux daphne]|uniref:Uncharacterized protein n=1 Tax=Herbiconiux daphne TaxID=2970914 RepID=A0ABT2H0E3_9MICO|nr:hypothetical protein [Herbiconiux daphne]MCS5732914.1 hypothetical protein [Herbiconiux daphne]
MPPVSGGARAHGRRIRPGDGQLLPPAAHQLPRRRVGTRGGGAAPGPATASSSPRRLSPPFREEHARTGAASGSATASSSRWRRNGGRGGGAGRGPATAGSSRGGGSAPVSGGVRAHWRGMRPGEGLLLPTAADRHPRRRRRHHRRA